MEVAVKVGFDYADFAAVTGDQEELQRTRACRWMRDWLLGRVLASLPESQAGPYGRRSGISALGAEP